MPATKQAPAWLEQHEITAKHCPRSAYARIVLKVCAAAERLVGSVLRRSYAGEREEAMNALRELERTRPPADLSNDDRDVLSALSHSLGSTQEAPKKGDPDGFEPDHSYGLLWQYTATFARDPITKQVTEHVELGGMELAVLDAIDRARDHFEVQVSESERVKTGSHPRLGQPKIQDAGDKAMADEPEKRRPGRPKKAESPPKQPE